MQLVRMRLENFRGVRECEVQFGPGVNVLHGPNELGKSTMVEAIRAALLLPSASKGSLSTSYVPWGSEEKPYVQLTLQTADGRYQRVTKTFGTARSRLESSNNNQDWSTVATAREVDQKVRELLNWGLADLGGKSGGRGMPKEYLVSALLAGEDGPLALLASDLEGDAASGGREQLSEALETMAEDPRVRQLLEQVEEIVGEVYTPTGSERRLESSPLVIARQAVVEAERALKETEAKAAKCCGYQQELEEAEAALAQLRGQEAVAKTAHDALLRQRGEEQTVRDRLARLRIESAAAMAKKTAISRAEKELERQESELAEQQAQLATARSALATAEEECKAAEQALAEATDERAHLRRQAEVAQLERGVAQQQSKQQALAAVLERCRQAEELAAQLEVVHQRQQASSAGSPEVSDEGELAKHVQQQEAVLAWHAVLSARKQLAGARAEQAQVRAHAQRIAGEEAMLVRLREDALLNEAPSMEMAGTLRALWNQLQVAQGALASGLSIDVQPLIPFSGSIRVDEEEASSKRFEQPAHHQAEREIEVSVDNLGSFVVRAGRAEAQAEWADLQSRWEEQAGPVLARAGVNGIEPLETMARRAQELRRDIAEGERRLAALEEEAARQQPGAQAETEAMNALEQAEAAWQPFERFALFAQAEAKRATLVEARGKLVALQTSQQQRQAEAQRQREAVIRAEAAREQLEREEQRLLQAMGQVETALGGPWGAARLEAQAQQQTCESEMRLRTAEIQQLQAAEKDQATTSKSALNAAQEKVNALTESVAAQQRAHEAAIAAVGQQRGNCEAAKAQLAEIDLPALAQQLAQAEEAAGALLSDEALAESAAALRQVQARAADAKSRVDTLGGHLGEYGVDQLELALERDRGAVRSKQAVERDVQQKYQAWRLLQQVMGEVHEEQATHLGSRLAKPVGARFLELTRGGYRLVMGRNLELEGVRQDGALRSIDSLSLGTQEQLAALLRLALAEQLGVMLMMDDHLAHSDPRRMSWFVSVLREAGKSHQILVWTCRPEDYAGEGVQVLDLLQHIRGQ